MIAAMLKSKNPGLSSWVFLGGRDKIRITGIDGDLIRIYMKPEDIGFETNKNGVFKLPGGVSAIRVEHLRASGSPVSVDIV